MKRILALGLCAAFCSCSNVERVKPDTATYWEEAPWVYDVGSVSPKNPLNPAADIAFTDPPAITAQEVTDIPAQFLADPFIFRAPDHWLLFFEVWNCATDQGDLGYASSPDGKKWTYHNIVLDEPFHLSYPFVFEDQGEHYMIPESAHAGGIRLYKADPFPDRWVFQKEIIHGELVDNSLLRFNGRWWIFTSERVAKLRLFSAERLEGPWVEHPRSPIRENDPSRIRCGGRPFVYEGKAYRVAQDCAPWYGVGSRIFEITKLTETDFEEREIARGPVLSTNTVAWAPKGIHQYDVQQADTNAAWLAVFDGARKAQPLQRMHLEWDNGAQLLGYSLYPTSCVPGQPLVARFYWKNLGTVPSKHPPIFYLEGMRDKERAFKLDFALDPEQQVYEMVLNIPADTPAGTYDLRCGLWTPKDAPQHLIVKSSIPVHRNKGKLTTKIVVNKSSATR